MLLIAATLYCGFLGTLSTQPYGSHPDEIGKINQIVSGKRNWNHPQLLLVSLEIATSVAGTKTPADRAQVGRYLSNFYAALTVFLFSIVGLRLFSPAAAWVYFLVFALNTAMLVAGRYIKEDILLILSVAVLSLAFTFDRVTQRDAGVMAAVGGLGCALAVSAKYVGVVLVAAFALAYFLSAKPISLRAGLIFAAVFLSVTLLINIRILFELAGFFEGFGGEFQHATGDHDGVSSGPTATLYFDLIAYSIPVIALVVLPALLTMLMTKGARPRVVQLLAFLLLAIFLYGLSIQLAPVKIPRYAFPALILIPLALLVTSFEAAEHEHRKLLKVVFLFPVLLVLYREYGTSTRIYDAIRNDTRDTLFTYVTTSPEFRGKVILADGYTRLGTRLKATKNPVGNVIRPPVNPNGLELRVASYSVDTCFSGQCSDVDFIAIACTTFDRFFRVGVRLDEANALRRELYRRWLRNGKHLQHFGSATDDLERAFGMYESPCIYILDNRTGDAALLSAGRY
jgi:hypothetical protein